MFYSFTFGLQTKQQKKIDHLILILFFFSNQNLKTLNRFSDIAVACNKCSYFESSTSSDLTKTDSERQFLKPKADPWE